MKNKKPVMFMLIAALVALGLLLAALPAAADTKPTIIVKSFVIKEGGAYVGRDFTLSVVLENIEPAKCANTLTTKVSTGFPFIMNGLSTLYSGDLCFPGDTTVDIPMRVDPTANGGFYQIELASTYETSTGVQFSSSNTLNIFVNGTPEISAHIINSNPLDIYPGDTGILTVSIENSGSFQAESLAAVLTAPKPLEVKLSKSISTIGVLAPKSGQPTEFAVEVPKNAQAKTYDLSLAVSYLDENKVRQTTTISLPLAVKKKAEFVTANAGSDSLYSNQKSKTIRLALKNTGTDTARKVRARLVPTFPFSTDGSVRYVEELAPGGSSNVDFSVDVDKNAKPGTYVLDIVVDFEDAQGKKLQDTTQATLVVNPKGFFRAVFLDYIVLWIIATGVFLVVMRRRRKMHAVK